MADTNTHAQECAEYSCSRVGGGGALISIEPRFVKPGDREAADDAGCFKADILEA